MTGRRLERLKKDGTLPSLCLPGRGELAHGGSRDGYFSYVTLRYSYTPRDLRSTFPDPRSDQTPCFWTCRHCPIFYVPWSSAEPCICDHRLGADWRNCARPRDLSASRRYSNDPGIDWDDCCDSRRQWLFIF